MPVGLILVLIILAASAAAEPPPIEGAELEVRAAGELAPTLDRALAATTEPYWVGWSVPRLAGTDTMCCFDGQHWGCSLDGKHRGRSTLRRPDPPLHGRLVVLARATAVGGSRWWVVSSDCPLAGAGQRVVWLEGAAVADSVATLAALLADRRHQEALPALAWHPSSRVDPLLEQFAAEGVTERLRRQAFFWLGESGDPRALDFVAQVLAVDGP